MHKIISVQVAPIARRDVPSLFILLKELFLLSNPQADQH